MNREQFHDNEDNEQQDQRSAQSATDEMDQRSNVAKIIAATGVILVLVAIGLWLYFGGIVGESSSQSAVATVNEEPIPREKMEQRVQQLEQRFGGEVSDQQRQQMRQQAVNQLVAQELLRQYAEKNNITVDQQNVEKRYQQLVQRAGGEEAFKKRLSKQGQTPEELKELVRLQLLQPKVADAVDAPVSDKQVRDRYNQLKKRMQSNSNGTSSASVPPFGQVEQRLRSQLEQQALVQKLREQAKVNILL
jgi:FKBP-type peptidyl-prolyl cis-trans isomerase (trigger factor)